MSTLHQIAPAYVCQIWPKVKQFLSDALEHAGGEYNIDQLQFMLVRNEHTLLVAVGDNGDIHGAATVFFENAPGARIAFISAIGGRMISNQDLFSQLVAWCKENGSTKIRGATQDAVARLWRQKFNFKARYTIVEMDIQ